MSDQKRPLSLMIARNLGLLAVFFLSASSASAQMKVFYGDDPSLFDIKYGEQLPDKNCRVTVEYSTYNLDSRCSSFYEGEGYHHTFRNYQQYVDQLNKKQRSDESKGRMFLGTWLLDWVHGCGLEKWNAPFVQCPKSLLNVDKTLREDKIVKFLSGQSAFDALWDEFQKAHDYYQEQGQAILQSWDDLDLSGNSRPFQEFSEALERSAHLANSAASKLNPLLFNYSDQLDKTLKELQVALDEGRSNMESAFNRLPKSQKWSDCSSRKFTSDGECCSTGEVSNHGECCTSGMSNGRCRTTGDFQNPLGLEFQYEVVEPVETRERVERKRQPIKPVEEYDLCRHFNKRRGPDGKCQ